jgi:hypothetical protein
MISSALGRLEIRRLKRIGFKAITFLPLQMSHAEMVTLLSGSYLVPSSELESICGKLEDVMLQLHGYRTGMKLTLTLAPQTPEQAGATFMAQPNLGHFLEPPMLDTAAKEFKDRIAQDCLFLDVDLSRQDIPTSELPSFLKAALDEANTVAESAVLKLKSLRPKRGY